MCHHGQEVGFGLLSCKRLVAGLDQFGFSRNTVRNITQKCDNHLVLARLRHFQCQLDREYLTIAPFGFKPNPALANHALLTRDAHAVHSGVMGCTVVVRHDNIRDVLSENFICWILKSAFRGLVEIQNPPVQIRDNDRIQGGFEDGIESGVGIGQFMAPGFRLLAHPPGMTQQYDQRQYERRSNKGQAQQGGGEVFTALVRPFHKN